MPGFLSRHLNAGERGYEDFEGFGVGISVRFKKEQQIRALDAHTQSGGALGFCSHDTANRAKKRVMYMYTSRNKSVLYAYRYERVAPGTCAPGRVQAARRACPPCCTSSRCSS